MASTVLGIIGERLARLEGVHRGYEWIQMDGFWRDSISGERIAIEAKCKSLWPGINHGYDFIGTGLDVYQVYSRMLWWNETKIRCKLLTFDSETMLRRFQDGLECEYYEAWLDELEASGAYVDREPPGKKPTRIYDISVMRKGSGIYSYSNVFKDMDKFEYDINKIKKAIQFRSNKTA